MDTVRIPHSGVDVSRIGLGTWAIGGWLWGGTDERDSIQTLHRAFDLGINLIDTAPVYGFGVAEEIVGKALKTSPHKDKIVLSTKMGLNWVGQQPFRDARKERVAAEIELSLKRLGVEHIHLYHVHWPDLETPFEETAEALRQLLKEGKIGAVAVSNFTPEMMDAFQRTCPIHALQSPYNLFEHDLDQQEVPYCKKQGIILLGYGALCRGLLSGRLKSTTTFTGDDLRQRDPKFLQPHFDDYLLCVERLNQWVQETYQKTVLQLALRWVLDQGIEIALWGVRRPDQLEPIKGLWDWKLSKHDLEHIEALVADTIKNPLPVGFAQPPMRSSIESLKK